MLGWLFERWCCWWADGVLVQSREDLAALPRARICRARKISFIGNGIELSRFSEPVEPAITSGSAMPVVLMVSRLVREKGCDDFFELARALSGEATFVHVGPFEEDQSDAVSASEVARISAAGSVTFVGPVDDVRPYLASADVVVLPSYREGIPRAAMEAAASGRPVAAYDIRGVREVVPPETGLLAPRGDVGALSGIVRDLVRDPDRRRRAADACRRHVLTNFSEDEVVARLRDVYRGLGARANSATRAGGFGGSRVGAQVGVRSPGPERAGDAAGRANGTAPTNQHVCLTVDVEDWYDGMAVLGHDIERPTTPASGLASLLRLLDHCRPTARVTLFVVGNYLDRVSAELAELAARGHEIASHGPDHGRLPEDPAELGEWLRRGREMLEERLQVPVRGFRSPRFDLPRAMSLGAFRDLLAASGYRYVSDTHQLGGASPITELPVMRLGRLPIGGGSYQRALPGAATSATVRRQRTPAVLYYHSYDFGASLPAVSSIRSLAEAEQLLGRQRITKIFTHLLSDYGSEACLDVAS